MQSRAFPIPRHLLNCQHPFLGHSGVSFSQKVPWAIRINLWMLPDQEGQFIKLVVWNVPRLELQQQFAGQNAFTSFGDLSDTTVIN